MTNPGTAVYGIRHHGPGSARSVRAALAGQRPDIVLIEGPPEADDLVALAADPDMRPPVALLGYVPGEPRQAAFWPFAVFSPEWQAITYALDAGVPVRFCDLPAAHQLALKAARTEQPEPRRRTDPVSELAAAAGYDDPERWWEDVVEHVPGPAVFDALAEAISILRADAGPGEEAGSRDAVREAHMRRVLRRTAREGFERIAVLCEGSDLLVALIQRQLVVGERLGAVPPATPMVPLQRDLQDQQRHLKLRPEVIGPGPRDYDLDLRKPNDLARSRLLYRLALLDVPWGTPQQGRTANIGTFREGWQLTWRPELDLALIEASMWGSTVGAAATQRTRSIAADATALDRLTALAEHCLLADLGDALPAVLAAVRDRAALDTDVTQLMTALPALVRAARYGDVRGTDPARLGEVATEMITRICAGLPAAVASLDETAGQAMRERIDAVHSATGLLADGAGRDRWLDTLAVLARGDDPPSAPREGMAPRCPPLISGRLTRLLLDAGRIAADEAGSRMSRALSAAGPASAAAGWAEGFLAGSGLLLVHDDKLLALADGWLAGLSTDAFTAVLPALRRTFGD